MKIPTAFERQQDLIDIGDNCIDEYVREKILMHASIGGVYDTVTELWGSGKALQGGRDYNPFMNKKYGITGELIGDAYCNNCSKQCLKDFARGNYK